MTRSLTVRKPTRCEIQELELMLEGELSSQVHRRAETILYYGLGLNGQQLAEALHVHPNTVYADLQAFERKGLACVCPLPAGGAPQQISDRQLNAIWRWVEFLPRDLGLPDPRWTLTNFREFLVQRQRVLKRISLEHLRRVLKKKIFASVESRANLPASIRNAQPF
jgi:transposase